MNMPKAKWKYIIVIVVLIIVIVDCIIIYLSFGSNKKTGNLDNNAVVENSKHNIIPKPLSYEEGQGEFLLTNDATIFVKGNTDVETDEIYKVAEIMITKLKPSTGFNLNILKSEMVNKGGILLTTLKGEENLGNEGYNIDVNLDNICISAYKTEGVFRGVQTLRQMLPPDIEKSSVVNDKKWSIPVSIIKDKPEYEYRGLMIDVARHFFKVDDIKRQIDIASQYKINKLHLHLTDDQGWRLEIKKWPDLTSIGGSRGVGMSKGGFYTQEEFKDIIKYAQERYIEVIPEFDMPGHTNAALASYGFLNKDGEKKSLYSGIDVGFSTLMCHDEKTYEFIEDIIKEVSEISPSKYIHIGGDESHSTKSSDYKYFVGRVSKIVDKYGKIPIGWDPSDTAPEASSNLVLQNWKDSNENAKKKGMKMIISIAGKAYLDMKYDETTTYGLTWAGFNSVIDAYSWDPTNYAPKELILGIEAPLWTETINNSDGMDYMIYPRLIGHAEVGWSSKDSRGWNDYKSRLQIQGERLKNQGVNYKEDSFVWKE